MSGNERVPGNNKREKDLQNGNHGKMGEQRHDIVKAHYVQ